MDLIYPALILLAYLSGSVSTAVLVCRLFTLPDPRIVGSHNPGATNVLRIGGSKAALATLAGDVLKTAFPILLADALGLSVIQLTWIGVASLIGHCFPVYFSFKGGKGVASMLTVVILVEPSLTALALSSWLISFWTFRRSSIASLMTALVVPIFASQYFAELLLPLSALSAVVFIRHRVNISNILQGIEPVIGSSKTGKN